MPDGNRLENPTPEEFSSCNAYENLTEPPPEQQSESKSVANKESCNVALSARPVAKRS